MKSNRTLVIAFVLAFLCLCSALLTIIGYSFLRNRPPSSLSNSGYYVRGSTIYYHPGFGLAEPFKINGADIHSFKILDDRYALDASRVYRSGEPIPDSDPATFEILKSPFSRDSRHVYMNGLIFSEDSSNFEILDENVSRDSQHIYWSTETISNDPAHLVIIGSSGYYTYIKDATIVYVNGGPIPNADPATFEIITDGYSHDASHVYSFDKIILNADLATFEILETPYTRDANTVYWMENIIPNADPKTFRVLNANFECSADARFAYYQNTVIQNFDASTLAPDVQVNNCTATELYINP